MLHLVETLAERELFWFRLIQALLPCLPLVLQMLRSEPAQELQRRWLSCFQILLLQNLLVPEQALQIDQVMAQVLQRYWSVLLQRQVSCWPSTQIHPCYFQKHSVPVPQRRL